MVSSTPVRVLATPSARRAAAALASGDIGVALYEIGHREMPGLGADLPKVATKLPRAPSVLAWDFLSIALAVHAADRFVVRQDFQDSWTRMIALEVELVDPAPWIAQADALAQALRFLSSDIWYLSFRAGGARPPAFQGNLSDRDCACLFSGGLDSLIGAIDLKAQGRRPLLVSQASPKEGPIQVELAAALGLADHRFSARAAERWRQPYEPSSRARSVLFFGYGVLAASTLVPDGVRSELVIPENGLISINAPLTRRHLGSLSTRTTHPHFIQSLQDVLDAVGLGVDLRNPYGFKTKGEMLAECPGELIRELAYRSYSCGKGKRLNRHCGRCIPCLIRQASFKAARMDDDTKYWAESLADHVGAEDLASARYAATNLGTTNVERWAAQAGPLPHDPQRRSGYVDVVRRGTCELRALFDTIAWP